ncbi:hypothetical protein GYMLUDRAFT_73553 [Collybiopsis luxurians FD-317 M1]|uniref:Uncharacterized protein n=1 Tax=Collybiopsis luxurians FD-317 M1 TaxID=944289 RepID=A0A0D0CXY9_9AGAR|nr:hypothetical protein GYMLUDRAFT_73553 [Collybiopsis luxurians FD-317 M1]
MRLINLSATAAVGLNLLSTVMAVPIINADSGNSSTVIGSSNAGAPLTARGVIPITIDFTGGPAKPGEASEEDKALVEAFVKEAAEHKFNPGPFIVKYVNSIPPGQAIRFTMHVDVPTASTVCEGPQCRGTIDKAKKRMAILESGKGRMVFSLQLAALLRGLTRRPPQGSSGGPSTGPAAGSSTTDIQPAQH